MNRARMISLAVGIAAINSEAQVLLEESGVKVITIKSQPDIPDIINWKSPRLGYDSGPKRNKKGKTRKDWQ